MAVGVLMPKAGITVEECVITEWLKKKGDHVNVGDVLFTYETDKDPLSASPQQKEHFWTSSMRMETSTGSGQCLCNRTAGRRYLRN